MPKSHAGKSFAGSLVKLLPTGHVLPCVLLPPSSESLPARPGRARGASAEQKHFGSCPLCPSSTESQPVSLGGLPDITNPLILEERRWQRKVAMGSHRCGRRGCQLPLPGCHHASCQQCIFIFFTLRDNSLNKLGRVEVANLPLLSHLRPLLSYVPLSFLHCFLLFHKTVNLFFVGQDREVPQS